MNTLQRHFENALQEAFGFPQFASRIIERKLRERGISLTEEQKLDLQDRLEKAQCDSITFEIEEEQVRELIQTAAIQEGGTVEIQFEEDELDDIVNRILEDMPRLIAEVTSYSAAELLEALKRCAPEMLAERSSETHAFQATVTETWASAFDLLQMFIVIVIELGSDFNEEFRPSAEADGDLVFEVMTRLHARACQIAQEVYQLLVGGFADGAHARWRSLHEIAAVAMLISSHDNDLAERYLLHDRIESYKAARQYQEHCAFLGFEPMTDKEFAEIECDYQSLLNRYGNEFRGDYGWAASVLHNPNPNFADIERAVGLDHLRPFYRLASHNVHANPKGVFFKLGLFPGNEALLLAGPSSTGLADPGHGVAISLGQVTTSLLTMRPNIDRLVACQILFRLIDEIGDELLRIQQSLENTGDAE